MFGLNKLKPDDKFMIVFGILFASTWGAFVVTVKSFGIWGLLSVGIIVLVWPAAKYILPDPETQPYKEQW